MTIKKAVRMIRNARNGDCVIKTAKAEKALAKLENGKEIPTASDLKVVADLLEVPVELFDFIQQKQFFVVSNPMVAKIMQTLNHMASAENELLGILNGTD